ncbi:hypothetical protein [Rhodoferax sp.]|uniref:hypothetical protein n=1 Tax=Rhodoferax sp. TaxID=50421 RepID=UPI002ACD7808|nr:hypothetical protein [Rhodoferax sp.]MDZ7918907.1 hypothetical protein [Rhodoferax sp.]
MAVLINKAMIEIPPGLPGALGACADGGKASQEMFSKTWTGAQGLAEDGRRYGAWMRAEAGNASATCIRRSRFSDGWDAGASTRHETPANTGLGV